MKLFTDTYLAKLQILYQNCFFNVVSNEYNSYLFLYFVHVQCTMYVYKRVSKGESIIFDHVAINHNYHIIIILDLVLN